MLLLKTSFRNPGLKLKISLIVVAIFWGCIWLLALLVSSKLQQGTEKMLSDQQFSMASYIANEIDHRLQNRIDALSRTAEMITAKALQNRSALQEFLDNNPALYPWFSGGVFVVGTDGVGVAEHPKLGRVGVYYNDRDYFQVPMSGKAVVSRLAIGKKWQEPVIDIAVPMKDKAGKVVGVLVGVTLLSERNFLGQIIEQKDGLTGSYAIVSPMERKFVIGTDPRLIMQSVPGGWYERYLAGVEGSAISADAHAVKTLSSGKRIPTSGWIVVASLPADEAFAPIRELERHVYFAAAALSLLVTLIVWAVVRHFLSPLAEASGRIARMGQELDRHELIPVQRHDEIGRLLESFNNLQQRLQASEEDAEDERNQLNALVDSLPGIVFCFSRDGRFVRWNRNFEETTGKSAEYIKNATPADFVPEGDRARILEKIGEALSFGKATIDGCLLTDSGPVPYFFSAVRLDLDNEPHLIGVGLDVSERRRNEERLLLASTVFNTAMEGIVVTDAAARIIGVNPAFTAITGYSEEEMLGKRPGSIKSGLNSEDFYMAMWQALAASDSWSGEIWNRRKDGQIYAGWLSISAVRNSDGRLLQYVGSLLDITELKVKEERAKHLAHFDVLTELPNRFLFGERLEQALKQANRKQGKLALMFVDLDRFKEINDSLGHDVGDQLLQVAAQRFSSCVRETDTVARLGGDEFVVLLCDLACEEDAAQVAKKIIGKMAEPALIGRHSLNVSASIGIAYYPRHGLNADELLKCADTAMYRTKQGGRNGFYVYLPDGQAA